MFGSVVQAISVTADFLPTCSISYERGVLRFLNISMNMSISLCSSVHFCFKDFEAVIRYIKPYNKEHI